MTTTPQVPGNPWEGHRPVRAYRQLGPYGTVLSTACEACSRSQGRVVSWPCPVVTVEVTSDADLDAELRELCGGT